GGHPVVVPVVVRLRLGGVVELPVQVPLADVAGGVPGLFEQLGQGEFAGPQVDLAAGGDPGVDAVAVGCAAGEDGRPGRGADGAGGVALGEADALFGEGVEVGGLDDRVAEAGGVAPAEVVGQEED